MKANEFIRQHLTEEYTPEATKEILESANAPGSDTMDADGLLESLGIADED